MVSTSTWLRIAVVPAITAARMTSPARSRTSSTVAARLTACEIAIASASVPERFGPSSGPGAHLVEVDVRLDEGRRDEAAAGVEHGALEAGPDLRDPLAGDRDVDPRAVDAGVVDDEVVGHQPESVSTASSKRSTESQASSSISSSRALAALRWPAPTTPSSRCVTTPPGPP